MIRKRSGESCRLRVWRREAGVALFVSGVYPLIPLHDVHSEIDCEHRKRCTVNDAVNSGVNDAASGGKDVEKQEEKSATVSAKV